MISATACDNLELASFKELMLRTCGLAFGKEREKTLAAGLRKRMDAVGLTSLQLYHGMLVSDQTEFHRLVELLTVNETYFFREPGHLKLLVDRIAPEIIAERNGPVRILSAGCSTGEEPYSIAIMLLERFGSGCERLFSIAGVDIDAAVIDTARRGIYGRYSFRGGRSRLLERYFEPCGPGEYRIHDAVGRLVEFDTANLLGDSYSPVMRSPDIILYRNVSIYFPSQVRRKVFGRLAETLNEGGYLIVGATETINHDVGILTLVERDSLFLYQKRPPPFIEERRVTCRGVRGPARPKSSPVRSLPSLNSPLRPAAGSISSSGRTASGGRTAVSGRDAGALFDEALQLARTERGDEALTLLDKLIAEIPSLVKAHSLKASVLLNSSRFPEARAACDGILALDPLCLEGHLIMGIIALHDGDGDEAYKRFRETIYLDASCWPAHFHLAGIVYSQGDSKRALSGYETALRLLENDSLRENGRNFFPLSFNAGPFMAVCRHKLALLKEKG